VENPKTITKSERLSYKVEEQQNSNESIEDQLQMLAIQK
jgi:hypothetical protein